MSDRSSFDELVGAEATGPERERLRRVHELLVEAGPPPELTPSLGRPPAVDTVRTLVRRPVRHRAALALVAAALLGAVFAAGYGVGNHRTGTGPGVAETIALRGTAAAPDATATLQVDREVSGNWPMTLTVEGLPKLGAPSYYVVYLVRGGHTIAPCGTFVVTNASSPLRLTLNAPYKLRPGDTWIVTRQTWQRSSPGPTVLRPARA